jgi:hypothetical protein
VAAGSRTRCATNERPADLRRKLTADRQPARPGLVDAVEGGDLPPTPATTTGEESSGRTPGVGYTSFRMSIGVEVDAN